MTRDQVDPDGALQLLMSALASGAPTKKKEGGSLIVTLLRFVKLSERVAPLTLPEVLVS